MKYSSYDDKFAAMQRRKDEQGMSEWWCQYCGSVVQPENVTYDERHDERSGGCGGRSVFFLGQGEHVNTDNSAVIANMQAKIDALEKAIREIDRLAKKVYTTNKDSAVKSGFCVGGSLKHYAVVPHTLHKAMALLEAEK